MAKAWKPDADWYPTVVSDLIDNLLPPILGTLTRDNAWKYVLACTLRAQVLGDTPYLHVNDHLSTVGGKAQAENALGWLRENFLDDKTEDPLEWIDLVGKEYEKAKGSSVQRNNVTGRTFETVIQELIVRLCGVRAFREPRLRTLQGFELAPPGYHSRPDLALFDARDFRFLISTKWTLRKERLGTYLHEAYYYRQRRADLQIGFVLNDMSLNIWHYLALDPLVDRAYHVHLPWLLAIHQPFDGLEAKIQVKDLVRPGRIRNNYERWLEIGSRIKDLSELFDDVDRLNAKDVPADPDDSEEADPDEIDGLNDE
jgi:hypothetical protein